MTSVNMTSVGEISAMVPAVKVGSSRVDIVVGGHGEESDRVRNIAATPSGGTNVECLVLGGGRLGRGERRINGNLLR